MHPQLEGLSEEFSRLETSTRKLIEGLSEPQLRWRPSETRWSILECLDHLCRCESRYLEEIDRALPQVERLSAVPDKALKHGWFGSLFLWLLEPPNKLGSKTLPELVPTSDRPLQDTIDEYFSLLNEFQDRLQRADGRDLKKTILTSPFISRFRQNLGLAFAIQPVHARRHLAQAKRAREHTNFPDR